MRLTYKGYSPKDLHEITDFLGAMVLYAPTFVDKTGRFADRNIETVFASLQVGLDKAKDELGQEKYTHLVDMSARMRAHFEADPKDETEDTLKGREVIDEMSDILIQHIRASEKTSSV